MIFALKQTIVLLQLSERDFPSLCHVAQALLFCNFHFWNWACKPKLYLVYFYFRVSSKRILSGFTFSSSYLLQWHSGVPWFLHQRERRKAGEPMGTLSFSEESCLQVESLPRRLLALIPDSDVCIINCVAKNCWICSNTSRCISTAM